MLSLSLIAGCSPSVKVKDLSSTGIPDSTYQGIPPVYADGSSVENLTEAYFTNTESLLLVNSKLTTLCKAAKKTFCDQEKSEE